MIGDADGFSGTAAERLTFYVCEVCAACVVESDDPADGSNLRDHWAWHVGSESDEDELF